MHRTGRSIITLVVIFILSSLIMASGCAQVEDRVLAFTASREACTAESNLPHQGSTLLINEAERQLARMNSSDYTHTTYVDEENGIFNYDCSGFVGYALYRADPCAFSVLLHKRPDAGNFYYHLIEFGSDPADGGWMRITTPLELHQGDIIVWLKPDSSDTKSTGHIMIVAGDPIENPERTREVLVRVIDSSSSMHSSDTRSPGQSGLGKGIIGIMTDSSGLPTGYYWRGGESRTFQETDMVFARIA